METTTQITHMKSPRQAVRARDELLSALGSENQPSQWMEFMEAVIRLLPDVLRQGRPSQRAIDHSIIGQLGFSGWREMIEAPVEQGGLGWNWHSWTAWRKAWAVVETNPWLRSQSMTASEINTLAQAASKSGMEFPGSPEALDALRQQQEQAREEKRAESLAATRRSVEELQQALQEAQAARQAADTRLAALAPRLDQAEALARDQAERIGALESERSALIRRLDQAEALADETKQQLQGTAASRDKLRAQIAAMARRISDLEGRGVLALLADATRQAWAKLSRFWRS